MYYDRYMSTQVAPLSSPGLMSTRIHVSCSDTIKERWDEKGDKITV